MFADAPDEFDLDVRPLWSKSTVAKRRSLALVMGDDGGDYDPGDQDGEGGDCSTDAPCNIGTRDTSHDCDTDAPCNIDTRDTSHDCDTDAPCNIGTSDGGHDGGGDDTDPDGSPDTGGDDTEAY